ncbi:MAG TPA: type II toxin-antitoxin system VapC family toxin [Candidatus Limnocylindrales bacterium]|nr:type II toxin-antitoxin system VapC family toxin [Candidatus Limnocylindrales bacterium]
MIFIDSNIPMYLIGADQALQLRARTLIEDAVTLGEVLCTDAEVLQEILHRYIAIRRHEFIDPAFETLLGVVDVVYPIEREDVERGRRVLRTTSRLSARDALHIAIMLRNDVDRVLTFDTGLDEIPGLTRID